MESAERIALGCCGGDGTIDWVPSGRSHGYGPDVVYWANCAEVWGLRWGCGNLSLWSLYIGHIPDLEDMGEEEDGSVVSILCYLAERNTTILTPSYDIDI